MKQSNPLEQLLFPPFLGQTRRQPANHPYENGMFISINNHKSISGELINQYTRQYETLIHSICGRKISRKTIQHTKGKPPSRKVVTDLVARKKLLVVAGIHDYRTKDNRGRGSRKNYEYQHTHFYVYGTHHYLPSEDAPLKAKEKQICRNFQRYTNTANKRYPLTRVIPVGRGIYTFTDTVTPATLYDYLLTASPEADRQTILNYIANNRHNQQIQYPLSYIYEE